MHTHLQLFEVNSEVLRYLSHVFADCVFNLDRSFYLLKEKFPLGVVNL